MFEEFRDPNPLLDALGRWLRPSSAGEWLPPRSPGPRRSVSRRALLKEFVTECAEAGQFPVALLAKCPGKSLSDRIALLSRNLTDLNLELDADTAAEAASWYRSWLQAQSLDTLQVGKSVCLLGSSAGWQRLNRPKPVVLRRERKPALKARNWVIENLEALHPPKAPALPLLCAAGLEVRGELDHLICLDLDRSTLLRKLASHGLRGKGLTWHHVRWALAHHRERPDRDWRERARTDPTLLFPLDVVLALGRSWRETTPPDTQAVAWEGGGILLPHYRWRGASETDWWDDRCRRYAS